MASQEQIAITKPMDKFRFVEPKIAQNTIGTLNISANLATTGTLNVKEYTAVWSGAIVGVGARLSETPTAGTLTITPLINGSLTAFSNTNISSALKQPFIYASQENDVLSSHFAAGDRIGLRYNADSAFAPNTQIDGAFEIYVLYDEVRV